MTEQQVQLPKQFIYIDSSKGGVRDTSLEAFGNILDKLSMTRLKVYNTIVSRGGKSWDKRIAEDLNWSINCVVPRRNELVKLGILRFAGTLIEPGTKRRVTLWELNK